jgi:hypothetical protein
MRNYHLVLGLSRGGTNLIWTALASFNSSIITRQEINEMCSTLHLTLYQKFLLESYCLKSYYLNEAPQQSKAKKFLKILINEIVDKEINAWLRLGQPYTPRSNLVPNSSSPEQLYDQIGLKMVSSWSPNPAFHLAQRNNPLKYLPLFIDTFNIKSVVIIIRNPLAQAEAWMRRGCTSEKAFYFYNKYIKFYIKLPGIYPECKFYYLRLEDFVRDPFHFTEILGEKFSLTPNKLETLRVAKLPSLTQNFSNHTDKISSLFTRDTVHQVIDPTIEDLHVNRFKGNKLSNSAINATTLYNSYIQFLK